MNLNRMIFRVLAFTPMLIVLGIVLLLTISFLEFGYFPQYGVDKDPYSVFSEGLMLVKNLFLILSFYLLIVSFLILITLLIIKINKINQREKIIALGIYAVGVLILVLLKESSAFEWLVD